MRDVCIVACAGVVPFDLAVPCEVFGRTRLADGRPGYRVRVCGATPRIDAGYFQLEAPHGLDALAHAHTIILPGVNDVAPPVPPALIRAVQRAAKRGARVASICSGAFLLAATGLLDGKRATTHWLGAEALSHRFPKVHVDSQVLYVDEGKLLTSAGAAAGLDLCLHMVRTDYGAAVAAEVARLSVMPLERPGGQAQFIVNAAKVSDDASLAPLLAWLTKESHRPHTLAGIARKARLSERSLNRRFREQTGTTPLQWLITARVRRGQALLETTDDGVERLAHAVGFGSGAIFREHFRRVVGTSPTAYRRAFRSVGAGRGPAYSA
ncbi:MAG: hypothetical protein RL385_1195 [Pseudomonadota bacterium]|jgi:transcriptional regulator GlxA family with amidase domain